MTQRKGHSMSIVLYCDKILVYHENNIWKHFKTEGHNRDHVNIGSAAASSYKNVNV